MFEDLLQTTWKLVKNAVHHSHFLSFLSKTRVYTYFFYVGSRFIAGDFIPLIRSTKGGLFRTGQNRKKGI